MVLGRRKEFKVVTHRPTEEEKAKQELAIGRKVEKLKSAIVVPPAIHQFKTALSDHETKNVVELFMKYKPENREEKEKRLSKENPREGPKPMLVKFGLRHVTDLIEAKGRYEKMRPRLVLIAGDVNPIENVIFLPTLCRKMRVAYAIVKNQEILGALVNLKRTTCVCLSEVRPEDEASFSEAITMCNAIFSDNYERHMSTAGGLAEAKRMVEVDQ
jgi:large subunit ribosomal protein L7Ae